MKEKLLHQVFVIIAQGHVKMTLRCNICFEYSLTLKVIKLAIFFSKNSRSLKYCKTWIEDQKNVGITAHMHRDFNVSLFHSCLYFDSSWRTQSSATGMTKLEWPGSRFETGWSYRARWVPLFRLSWGKHRARSYRYTIQSQVPVHLFITFAVLYGREQRVETAYKQDLTLLTWWLCLNQCASCLYHPAANLSLSVAFTNILQ